MVDHLALVSTSVEQPPLFENLVEETHELIRQKRELEGEYIEIIIKIGQNLNEMKPNKPHGDFIPWVQKEFHLKRTTAQDYMRIALVYGANVQRAEHLPERVLSVLAAPSTSDDVRRSVESGHIPATPKAIREANKARIALSKVEQWAPEERIIEGTIDSTLLVEEDIPIDLENCQIYPCAIADLHRYVTAESLDAIITDPPYPREFLSVYNDLADFAIHALKPGGSLITMVGQSHLPDILDRLRKGPLKYHWLSCYYVPGDTTKIWRRRIGASWKPLLWFVKGEYVGPWVKDVIREDVFAGRKKDKKHHEWGQPVADMENIIEYFTQPGQFICDPFLGGGTTAIAALHCKRRFIGCDIDPECIQITQQRIRAKQ